MNDEPLGMSRRASHRRKKSWLVHGTQITNPKASAMCHGGAQCEKPCSRAWPAVCSCMHLRGGLLIPETFRERAMERVVPSAVPCAVCRMPRLFLCSVPGIDPGGLGKLKILEKQQQQHTVSYSIWGHPHLIWHMGPSLASKLI